MQDGTRLIFWLDLLVLLAGVFLAALGQWDWVIALFVGMVLLNTFDRWLSGRRRR